MSVETDKAVVEVDRKGTRFLLIHGTNDVLVPIQQSRDMCTRMNALGNACQVYPVEGAGHGMRYWQSTAYQQEIVRWLDSRH